MKKLLFLLLAVALLCGLIACGGAAQSPSVSETEPDPSGALPQKDGPEPPQSEAPAESSEIVSGTPNSTGNQAAVAPTESRLPYDGVFPQHEAYGTGVGVMPGRVVWAYDPDSVDWDGSGYWWEPSHFNEAAILNMVRGGITALGGKDNASESWQALFAYNNQTRDRVGGYQSGEKLAIKVNMNGHGTYGRDEDSNLSYTNPVALKALLVSLVEDAGVSPEDITVYDVTRIFPDWMMELCSEGNLAGVQFRYFDLGGVNEAVADTNVPIQWSQSVSGDVSYLPQCVTEADYLINFAELKGHDYGVTLCAKNHFGSFANTYTLRAPQQAGLHGYLTQGRMGTYTVLVDLMANYQLGEKTVLYLLDGIIAAASNTYPVTKETTAWSMAPFNGDDMASIFFSQDPVAIDSVAADFLINEPNMTGHNSALRGNIYCENYLHEAALVSDPPSGAVYLNGDGEQVTNLGAHEHWSNATEKQYSRNLGGGEGIELIPLSPNP